MGPLKTGLIVCMEAFSGEVSAITSGARPVGVRGNGDLSGSNVSGSGSCGVGTPVAHSCGTSLRSLATIRGLVGYDLGGNWLVYGTGGYAGGELHAWDALAGGSGTKFLSGWSPEGPCNRADPKSVAQVRVPYVDLGRTGVFDVVPGVTETVSFSGDIFRVGLDLKFGSYAPAYARPIYTK